MKKFIYSISEIFNTQNGCLFSYDVSGYYIAPYQRGFKWKSASIYDQVPVLLMDLYEAFCAYNANGSQAQEYYLQYITVKTNSDNNFEVIDGQQRLTTITLLYNTLEYAGEISAEQNIVKHNTDYLVNYARYEHQDKNIFNQVIEQIKTDVSEDEQIKEQDKYFMVKAMRCILKFFSLFANDDNKTDFIDFISQNVKIILNKEDDTTSAEEIFANLNSNKVPLTNAYLIKGLLLTKASRYANLDNVKRFKEVMDQRSIMGRTWDEIIAWFSKPDVSLMFFGTEENGIEHFLEAITLSNTQQTNDLLNQFKERLSNDETEYKNPYTLFNKYHENIITAKDSFEILDRIKHTYWKLKSWYNDNEMYNLIAFRQAKRLKNDAFDNTLSFLNEANKLSLISSLKNYVVSKMPTAENNFLTKGYNEYKATVDLLLAINIFQINIGKDEHVRFNFYDFQNENWSLEHIFPQNPNLSDFDVQDDKFWVLKEIDKRIRSLDNTDENNDEIETLKKVADNIKEDNPIETKDIDFIFEQITDVNVLGNMALLSRGVNSALSNGFFNTKRVVLLNKINKGSFVPKHTIDVFSKMLDIDKNSPNFDESLTTWSQIDIDVNEDWIAKQTKAIIDSFSSKVTDANQTDIV